MAGLRTRKKQRLTVMIVVVAVIALAAFLIVFAGRQSGSFNLFLQPAEVLQKNIAAGQRFRLGGLVASGSYHRLEDGLTYEFRVTDCAADIKVHYKGLMPSLFREGQGVVTEGALNADGLFVAETVLAKHDENYAPPGTMPKNEEACDHPVTKIREATGR